MTCAMTKKKGEVIYPAEWLNRTGLEDQIFADEPFPGVGLRTDDLDVPPYSSFFASPESPPSPGAKSGLDVANSVQPAPLWLQAISYASELLTYALALSVLIYAATVWL